MTFEKILTIFSEHLKNDENIEIIKVKKGYLHLYWDKVCKDYQAILLTTFEDLFNKLLDDVESYYQYESNISFASEDERKIFIKNLQDEYCNKFNMLNM